MDGPQEMNVPTPASAPHSSAFWPIVARHVLLDRRAGRIVAYGLMVLSVVLRLALVPATGNTNDLLTMIGFGAQVASHGPQALYDTADHTSFDQNFVYTPLFPFMLGATYRLWGLVATALPFGIDAIWVPPYPVAAALVKFWAIGADLACAFLIFSLLCRWHGRSRAIWACGRAGVGRAL